MRSTIFHYIIHNVPSPSGGYIAHLKNLSNRKTFAKLTLYGCHLRNPDIISSNGRVRQVQPQMETNIQQINMQFAKEFCMMHVIHTMRPLQYHIQYTLRIFLRLFLIPL